MQHSLMYTVAEGWDGEITVSSFLGRTRAEERKFALTMSRKVHLITGDRDQAQRRADAERKAQKRSK